jgi:uncharacterized protein (TIRG00374 family)
MENSTLGTPQPIQPTPSITLSKRSLLLVTLLIVAILFFFIRLIDFQAVGRALQTADLRFLALASAMLIAGMVTFAIRWRRLMANQPSWLLTFHAANAGHAGNMIIPLRGGEVIRILILGQSRSVSYAEATSSYAIERLLETIMRYLTLILAILYGVGLRLDPPAILATMISFAVIFLLIAWLMRRPDLAQEYIPRYLGRLPFIQEQSARRWIADVLASLQNVGTLRAFMVVMGWSLITWFFWGVFFYFTILALGDAFSPDTRLAITLATLALSPPSAPTQPGIFHASIVVPLAALGYDQVGLTAFAVAAHALEMVWMIGLGLIGLARSGATMRNFIAVT